VLKFIHQQYLFKLYVRLDNIVLLYSVENRDGYWQNFFARNSKLRPENGGTGNRTQAASRSRSGVISGQDSTAAAAAVPPSRSMSATALPPVPIDEKTTAMRNDCDSNQDASSVNITAGKRLANLPIVSKKSEKASFMLCTGLHSMVVKSKVAGPQISSEIANPQISGPK
jgi:hypothetical protein